MEEGRATGAEQTAAAEPGTLDKWNTKMSGWLNSPEKFGMLCAATTAAAFMVDKTAFTTKFYTPSLIALAIGVALTFYYYTQGKPLYAWGAWSVTMVAFLVLQDPAVEAIMDAIGNFAGAIAGALSKGAGILNKLLGGNLLMILLFGGGGLFLLSKVFTSTGLAKAVTGVDGKVIETAADNLKVLDQYKAAIERLGGNLDDVKAQIQSLQESATKLAQATDNLDSGTVSAEVQQQVASAAADVGGRLKDAETTDDANEAVDKYNEKIDGITDGLPSPP